jgi:hypothetical protein
MTDNDPSVGHGLPLKITVDLPYDRGFTRFSVRVEGLGPGARLSLGINNGDGTWSLTPDQLPGLRYLPADNDLAMRLLMVRLIGFKYETAETVTAFSVLVAPSDAGLEEDPEPCTTPAAPRGNNVPNAAPDEIRALLAAHLANARRQWSVEAERSRRIAEAALTTDVERRLEAAISHITAAQKRAIAQATMEFEREMRHRLLEARTAFEQEMSRRLTEAETRWRDAEALRSQVTQRRWRSERSDDAPLPPKTPRPTAGGPHRRWLGQIATHALAGALIAALVLLAPIRWTDPSADGDDDPLRRITVQTTQSLHDRPAPSGIDGGDVVGIATPGMDLRVLAVRGDWMQVAVPDLGVVGWIETSRTATDTRADVP